MLHIFDRTAPDFGDVVLRNMFEARKRVFVDLLGWDVPVLAGRFELDQFDTPEATYVVVTGPDGRHRASARLLPTLRPHLLDTVFASLCAGAVPRGAAIREISRFCLDRSLNARDRRTARDELVSALARFGAGSGFSLYTGVAEPGWLEQILAFGWRARRLGPAGAVGGVRLGALAIDIDAATPALLARAGIGSPLALAGEVSDAA